MPVGGGGHNEKKKTDCGDLLTFCFLGLFSILETVETSGVVISGVLRRTMLPFRRDLVIFCSGCV